MVITVCSQKLIIGRYILNSEEFVHIPDTKSGFFEIQGYIINGAGPAGSIKILCAKGVADKPMGPKRSPRGVDGVEKESPTKGKLVELSTISFLFVKVVSMAVIDMKSVHLLEVNSPAVSMECGGWAGVSDVVRGAGMAARWNSLNWKFSVKKEQDVVAVVSSNGKLIGKVAVTMEEIRSAEVHRGS